MPSAAAKLISPPTSAVEFRSVRKNYGNGPAILDSFSLTAAPGDFISLIGPSGCGKSTLLKLIAGLSPVTSGELLLGGRVATPERVTAGEELAYVYAKNGAFASLREHISELVTQRGITENYLNRIHSSLPVRLLKRLSLFPTPANPGP